jgi:hypothetical protein
VTVRNQEVRPRKKSGLENLETWKVFSSLHNINMAHLVIDASLLSVSQNVICLVDLLELLRVAACRQQHGRQGGPAGSPTPSSLEIHPRT